MLGPNNDEGRPLAGPASNVIADGSQPILPTYCHRCGALLTARSSVSRGTGPICARLEVVV